MGKLSMALIVYIHGFNSGRQSRSAQELEKVFKLSIFKPEYDCAKSFEENIQDLEQQICKAVTAGPMILLGSSLGGFYALSIRLANIERIVTWNPVIYPALQLKQFLGYNVRFTDNKPWIFAEEALLSYAKAPDPRQWQNFRNKSLYECPPRVVILGDADEILDSNLAAAYWGKHAQICNIKSGHSVENYDHVLNFLDPEKS